MDIYTQIAMNWTVFEPDYIPTREDLEKSEELQKEQDSEQGAKLWEEHILNMDIPF